GRRRPGARRDGARRGGRRRARRARRRGDRAPDGVRVDARGGPAVTEKQRQAAKRNIKKAQQAAKQKRTIAHLPKSTRRGLQQQAQKGRQRGRPAGRMRAASKMPPRSRSARWAASPPAVSFDSARMSSRSFNGATPRRSTVTK